MVLAKKTCRVKIVTGSRSRSRHRHISLGNMVGYSLTLSFWQLNLLTISFGIMIIMIQGVIRLMPIISPLIIPIMMIINIVSIIYYIIAEPLSSVNRRFIIKVVFVVIAIAIAHDVLKNMITVVFISEDTLIKINTLRFCSKPINRCSWRQEQI